MWALHYIHNHSFTERKAPKATVNQRVYWKWITIPFRYHFIAPATIWITVASVSCVLFDTFRNFIELSSFETPVPEDKKCKKIIAKIKSKNSVLEIHFVNISQLLTLYYKRNNPNKEISANKNKSKSKLSSNKVRLCLLKLSPSMWIHPQNCEES